MERQPITNLDLEVFDPEKGSDKIKTHAVNAGLIPHDNPSIALLKKAAQTEDPEFFMTKRGKMLQERVNKAVYESIEQKYDLMRGAGKSFWERQWQVANEQVETLINTFAKDDDGVYGLLDEVAISPKPASVIRYLSANNTNPRLRFELTRQAGLAFIAAELDSPIRTSKERLAEVQEWLALDVFKRNSNEHPERVHKIWTWHNNATNEPLCIDNEGVENHDNSTDEKAHWKLHNQRMRYAGDDIGWVRTTGRVKEGGVNKTVKKAILRERSGAENYFDPLQDVPDIMGMQFIVKDEDYFTGEKVQNLITKVRDSLSEKYPGIIFTEKNETTGDMTKSGNFQAYRLMGKFPDMDTPIELMFLGQLDHLMNTHYFGEIDEKTQNPKGGAHKIMELKRGILLMEDYFPHYPPDAPEEQSFYGKPNWDEVRRVSLNEVTERLRNSHLPNEPEITPNDQQTEFTVFQADQIGN